jgi:hypothetical protein
VKFLLDSEYPVNKFAGFALLTQGGKNVQQDFVALASNRQA